MESKDEINRLFQKLVDKTIRADELAMFYSYIQKPEHTQQIQELLAELWDYLELTEKQQSGALSTERPDEIERKRRLMEVIIKATEPKEDEIEAAIEIINKEYGQEEIANKKQGLWGWFRGLFVLVAIVAAGTWYYFTHQDTSATPEIAYVEKVSDFGQKSTIPLPDGSIVKLNSGSKLIFPKLFEGDTREVSLEGEAFFEVARDEQKPFVVRSGILTTKVLGTSFNIKAYPEDKQIAVAVATGKVKVETVGNATVRPRFLSPNMVAMYDATDAKINVESRESITDLIAWREGVLKFNGVPFSEVARTLEKWYGVNVVLENEGVGDCIIFGEFKNESLKSVMKTLQYAIDIDYELTADGLSVSGKGCRALN